jgi:hypothetical protein
MTVWKLEIWKETSIWRPPYDATIDINIFSSFKFNKKLDPNHQIREVQN